MAKLTKLELIEQLAKAAGCSKSQARDYLDALLDIITKSLKKRTDVALTGFGTFTTSRRKARIGRNPQTGEQIKIPAKRVVRFRVGKGLKEAVA